MWDPGWIVQYWKCEEIVMGNNKKYCDSATMGIILRALLKYWGPTRKLSFWGLSASVPRFKEEMENCLRLIPAKLNPHTTVIQAWRIVYSLQPEETWSIKWTTCDGKLLSMTCEDKQVLWDNCITKVDPPSFLYAYTSLIPHILLHNTLFSIVSRKSWKSKPKQGYHYSRRVHLFLELTDLFSSRQQRTSDVWRANDLVFFLSRVEGF